MRPGNSVRQRTQPHAPRAARAWFGTARRLAPARVDNLAGSRPGQQTVCSEQEPGWRLVTSREADINILPQLQILFRRLRGDPGGAIE